MLLWSLCGLVKAETCSSEVGDLRGDLGPLMLTGVGMSPVREAMETVRLCSWGICIAVAGLGDSSAIML